MSSSALRSDRNMIAQSAIWKGVDHGFTLVDNQLPRLAPGEVLVAIELATICGSDLHTIAGDRPTPLPTVLGHEAVGHVVETGGEVRAVDGSVLKPGQRVTWTIGTACGKCRTCLRGVSQKCLEVKKYGHEEIGEHWHFNGGFASYCHLLSGTGIVTVPEALPPEAIAPANCATATVVSAARRAGMRNGDTVVVLGCGMLGLTAVAYAKQQGAHVVIACDVDSSRRDLAEEFGADVTCGPGDLRKTVMRESGEYGADVVFELSGNSNSVQASFGLLALDGRVALVGSVSPSSAVEFEPSTIVRNLTRVIGCHNYQVNDLQEAVRFLGSRDNARNFANLISEPFPLARIDDAVEEARRGSAPRVGIRMD